MYSRTGESFNTSVCIDHINKFSVNLAVPYSSCSIHAPPAHAAYMHRQLMQHSHTVSSCTASSCSIDTPPAHAAFTHRQYPILTFWGRTRPRVNPGNCQIMHRSFPLDRPLYCTGCTCGLEVKLGAEPPGILPWPGSGHVRRRRRLFQ